MQTSIPQSLLLKSIEKWDTPQYIYDIDRIEEKIRIVKESFHVKNLEIRFACKALSNTKILQAMYAQGVGVDTVSVEECKVALMAGLPPEVITFTPSGVRLDEYAFAIQQGIRIHVDQMHVLQWLHESHPEAAITLRFNPGIRAGGNTKLQVGADDSKFGIQEAHWNSIYNFLNQTKLKITGVHLHMGSDIKEIDSYKEAMLFLLDKASLFIDTLQQIDIGGGWKVPYHPVDSGLDISSFGGWIATTFNSFNNRFGKNLALTVEPGKFLVSDCGYLLMEVTGIRDYGDESLVYVNSGFNHFIRPMYYDAYHHIYNVTNAGGQKKLYTVAGYLCETDNFAQSRMISEIRRGDILCLINAGAYGFTMASQYNSRVRPPEIGRIGNQLSLLRRRETIDDILRSETEII